VTAPDVLLWCPTCGCLVEPDSSVLHAAWHTEMLKAAEALAAMAGPPRSMRRVRPDAEATP
jgi:hypothetical protein